MKYNVLFITTSDLSGKSGHNIATNEILESFAINQKIDLFLICPKPRSYFSEIISSNAKYIDYYNVWAPRTPLNIFPINIIVAHYLIYVKVRKLLKRQNNISFMVARLGSLFYSPVLIKKLKDIPYFLLIRGLSNFRGFYRIKYLNKIDNRFAIRNIKLSDGVYVAYTELKSVISKYVESEKIKVFNNAVNPCKFELHEKRIARKSIGFNLKDTDFIVGFVGSIQHRHHIRELIDAVEYIYSNYKIESIQKVKVLIIGDGPLMSKLKKHVNENKYLNNDIINFTGFVHHDIVANYLSACDVLYGVKFPRRF